MSGDKNGWKYGKQINLRTEDKEDTYRDLYYEMSDITHVQTQKEIKTSLNSDKNRIQRTTKQTDKRKKGK